MPPGVRIDGDLGAGALHRVGGVEVCVADEETVGVVHEHVQVALVAAFLQVQPDMLRDRAHPVVLCAAIDEVDDVLDVGRGEGVLQFDGVAVRTGQVSLDQVSTSAVSDSAARVAASASAGTKR